MRPRLLYLVTHPLTADRLLRGQLGWMQGRGYAVRLVTSPGPQLPALARREGIPVDTLTMAREIAPLRDLLALARLWRTLRRLRPTIVNASTPKAGLLGMLAARLAGTPVRVYTLRGLRLETTAGARRALLAAGERAAAAAAHRILCVSESLWRRHRELRLGDSAKTRVLGDGSSNGVDLARFPAGDGSEKRALALRRRLGIADDAPVIGYVGRFTRDKGIADLQAAFAAVARQIPTARLLLVGELEEGDPVPAETRRWLGREAALVRTGFVDDTAPFYSLMQVLAFPSHREGMPNAPLEAAAVAVPTVGYAVTGTVDAIEPEVTGVLVERGDRRALADGLMRYLRDDELRRSHGEAGRRRVEERFRNQRVWSELDAEYRRLLSARGLPLPTPREEDARAERAAG